jgi:hypothetical protein
VPECDRSQPTPIFNEFVAVQVPNAATLTALDVDGRELGVLIVALCIGVSATGYQRTEPILEFE